MEKTRGLEDAAKIGMAHLTRAWQMLLKGIRETELAAGALMAAEMVLIRLAYAADLPSGEELARLASQSAPAERPRPAPAAQLLKRESDQPPLTNGPLAMKPELAEPREASKLVVCLQGHRHAAERRDIKLRNDLERLVRPIRVSPGQIELAMEQGASPGLANELARKLEAWTGMRWMVLVAKDGGDKPLALQQKEARESLFRAAREHPDVQAILKRFPGAEIVDVRDPEPQVMETDEESQ
jgi:DNA polymerase-3 subunit gamma/tau